MTDKHEGHTVTANALVAKRADILFEIGELEKPIDQLRSELVHLVVRACNADRLKSSLEVFVWVFAHLFAKLIGRPTLGV